MTAVCSHCRARKWKVKPKGMWCVSGKVHLLPVQKPPDLLYALLNGDHSKIKGFIRNNLRTCNSAFQMTSFGANRIIESPFVLTFNTQEKELAVSRTVDRMSVALAMCFSYGNKYTEHCSRDSIVNNIFYFRFSVWCVSTCKLYMLLIQQSTRTKSRASAILSIFKTLILQYLYLRTSNQTKYVFHLHKYFKNIVGDYNEHNWYMSNCICNY